MKNSLVIAAAMGVCSLGHTSILVDFDMAGRNSSEVTEPGYLAWPVTETSTTDTTVDGITFALSRYGSAGTAIKTDWYKAGIQSPYYARLVSDGLTVVDGNSGGSIQLTISGLSAGTHTLLSYHNTTNGYDYAQVNVTVNGTKQVSNLTQTNRATSTSAAATSYVTFTVASGQTVTILYTPNTSSSSAYKNVMINGFALDVPNSAYQATDPVPADQDLHANADAGSISLSWTKASNAASHDVYFGTDSATIASATHSSATYQGNQTASSFTAAALSNLKIYYWRVDEVTSGGVVTRGNVWRFSPRHLAFPGAEGHGRFARGGRGGKVVHVTNLNDAGAGSLRAAVETDIGPRTIVFDVAGIITLQSRLTLASNHVTIAGQTAPGKGIVIRSAPFGFSGVNDGIMRFVRVRLGYGQTYDGTGLQGSNYCIFDHNSVSWTIDESFSSRSGKNITLQRTMLAEALNIADHQNYPSGTKHGYAASIGGDTGSYHHNLLAHNEGRNWSLAGGLDGAGYYAGRLDIFNNVVYNWGGRATDGGAHEVNFVNNYYKEGAATNLHLMLNAQLEGTGLGSQAYYYKGNVLQAKSGSLTCNGSSDDCGRQYVLSNGQVLDWSVWASSSFFPSYATVQTATEAYKDVLSDVGATMPVFDDHDVRIVRETYKGTYTYTGSISKVPGLPDRESDVGGYESYPTTSRASGFDTDGDGMPDWWETYIGTSTGSASGNFSESNADRDGDGYTNLEEYLNWMATPHLNVTSGTAATLNLAPYFRGYASSPAYTVTANSCFTTSIKDSTLTLTANSLCGVVYLSVQVKDGSGSTKTRQFGVFVEGSTSGATTTPPEIIKHGAGSSSQTVVQGDSIVGFYFSWTNATTVTVSGVPTGVSTVIDNSAQTISFSGAPTAALGAYTYTITTVGGSTDATRQGTITITDSAVPVLSSQGGTDGVVQVKLYDMRGRALGATLPANYQGIYYLRSVHEDGSIRVERKTAMH